MAFTTQMQKQKPRPIDVPKITGEWGPQGELGVSKDLEPKAGLL